jgi:hypothetical protein
VNKSYPIVIVIIVAPILLIALNQNLFYPIQVNAQTNNTDNTISSNLTSDIANNGGSEQSIVLRGIVSSEDFNNVTLKTGEDPHGAPILPNRDDGTIYTGIVTFTATKPVEVGISHRLHIDNNTFSQIDTDSFGKLYSGYHNGTGERGTPGVLSAPSVIVPDYGTAPPYFSASIPFVGDSVWLRTTHGEPFIAVYEVFAEIVQPQGVVDLVTAMNN